jgi:hypothetical protein
VTATAAVVLTDDEDTAPAAPGTPSGWTTVTAPRGPDGVVVSYAVPGTAGWHVRAARDAVSYRGADGTPYARGDASALYYGNGCATGGRPYPAAWTLLGDPGVDRDLTAYAVAAARAWARGYGGEAARAATPATSRITLPDGTPAVRAEVRLDLARFDVECLGTRGDLVVVAFPAGDRIGSLVVARYVGVTGGLRSADVDAIIATLRRADR